jgi:hypothetical protein
MIPHGGTLEFTGVFQVGNIYDSGRYGGTTNPGIQFGLEASVPGTGDVVRLNIQNTKDANPIQQTGHQDGLPYLGVRDTIPGINKNPFDPCGPKPQPIR